MELSKLGIRCLHPAFPPGILFAVIMFISGLGVQCFSQNQDVEARLRARIEAFWNAMAAGDYDNASAFIHPDSREYFVHRLPKSTVQNWKLEKLNFNKDRTECDAAMLVAKPIPMYGKSIDWPLQNHWVLSSGEWFFQLPWERGENPMLKYFKNEQEKSARPATPETPAPRPEKPDPKEALNRLMKPRIIPAGDNPNILHSGEKAVFRYKYENTGSQPIKVISVVSDCHCTSIKKEYPEVPPGENGIIEVTLDTFGLPLGPIEKEVAVQFSDLPYPTVIQVRSKNLPNFAVEPQNVDFGVVEKGKPAQAAVRITNHSGRTARLLSGSNSDLRLRFKLEPDEFGPEADTSVILHLNTETSGEFMDILMLRTSLEAEPFINIRVKGLVKP